MLDVSSWRGGGFERRPSDGEEEEDADDDVEEKEGDSWEKWAMADGERSGLIVEEGWLEAGRVSDLEGKFRVHEGGGDP